MTIGPMRQRITLQARTTAPDPFGQDVEVWTTVGTYWASIRQLTGREIFNADRLKYTANHVIEMRYAAPINPATSRILFNGRTFRIEQANNVLERNRQWELMVTEVKNPT